MKKNQIDLNNLRFALDYLIVIYIISEMEFYSSELILFLIFSAISIITSLFMLVLYNP